MRTPHLLPFMLLFAASVSAQAPSSALSLEDALRVAQERNYTIRIGAAQIQVREGEAQAARGTFDPLFSASLSQLRASQLHTSVQQAQLGVDRTTLGQSVYRAGLSKRFSSGMVVSPGLEVTRSDDLTLGTLPLAQTRASLFVSYPLLRDRGLGLEVAQIEAAEAGVTASQWQYTHTNAQSLFGVASAYWSYAAAQQSLGVFQDAEQRAQRLLQETQTLVSRDERPQADLDQLQANLADKITARIGGERAVFEARQQLGLQLGLSAAQAGRLALPEASFPALADVQGGPPTDLLIERAQHRRADLQQAQAQQQAAVVLLEASRREQRPRLDLQFDIGYAGQHEGNLDVATTLAPHQVGGPSGSVSLVYDWAFGNSAARGQYARYEARLRQQELALEEQRQQVSAGVAIAYDALQTSAQQLSKAREAVRLYQRALDNEQQKLRLGM
ncbi:MAG: TolC family protein [Bacteroidota bacterium]